MAGIHHVTSIAGRASRNLDFYTRVLGLRLVKKTVNFDDPLTWHLYFGDEAGNPGTILTFFPWEHAAPGRRGVGEHGVERARRRFVVVSERRRFVMGERRGIVLDIEVAEQFLFEIDLERRSIVRIVGRLRLVLARIMTHDPRQFGERIGVVELRTHVRSERVAVCHTHFSQSPPPRCLRHRGRIGPTSALWAKGDEAAWVYLAHLGRSFRSDQRQAGRQDIRNGLHQTQPGMSQFWVVNLNKA